MIFNDIWQFYDSKWRKSIETADAAKTSEAKEKCFVVLGEGKKCREKKKTEGMNKKER